MPANQPRFSKNAIDDLQLRVEQLEKQLRLLNTRRPHVPLMDFSEQGTPFAQDGALMVNYRSTPLNAASAYDVKFSYGGEWHSLYSEDYRIKVITDGEMLLAGDGIFIFVAPKKINQRRLVHAEAMCTTASTSGIVTVQLRNITQGYDMLSTRITIDVGEFTSETAAIRSVINPALARVTTGDRVAIDIDVPGTSVRGLITSLSFVA